ncbi:hypothetical protein DAKH74_035610 [Maudiozyma humilis]|uniref:Rhodanese domain-containing protein n=1 Tax=Maudiozyma humilis TaxID=51915 RepID=A0AAV5RZV6_MAUHU|nr:hypothetical protein DAKH74_035610 [Kazachstania humilis]
MLRTSFISAGRLVRSFSSTPLSYLATKSYKFNDVNDIVSKTLGQKLLIDVREPEEFAKSSIPTAVNIPVNSTPGALSLSASEFQRIFSFEKPLLQQELVFFCTSGARASAAAELASSFGYVNTGVYHGSMNEWNEKAAVSTD